MGTRTRAGRSASSVVMVVNIPGIGPRVFSLAKNMTLNEEHTLTPEHVIGQVRWVDAILHAVDNMYDLQENHRFDLTLRQRNILPTDGTFHNSEGFVMRAVDSLTGATLEAMEMVYAARQNKTITASATITADVNGVYRRGIDAYELSVSGAGVPAGTP